jgi:major vault protein
MPEIQGQLVLAQNQHAFIQDSTKGTVQVYAGPHALALSGNDRPVVYDNAKDQFVEVTLREAIKQNPLVPEGHYLVMENPAFRDDKLYTPKQGANSPTDLQVGRKINIPGPATFPLWPGQFAQSVPGHHLRSNQYLVVRVYNAEQASKNAVAFGQKEGTTFSNGQLLVIKGTEVPFFIPPTGFEVLQENNNYTREALTLERLEYCILLDEDGNKRYEKGPQVVFPEATERFVTKDNSKKFKAIELNDQMGLYIKVIADYEEDLPSKNPAGEKAVLKTGEELFITGKEQRIYYPRPEHALIGYRDPAGFERQRYYGIAIPKGEGRYVLVKDEGDVRMEKGPQIFLPDPRNQVIIRRVLDEKTVRLWYPGNDEALEFNENLRDLLEDSGDNYIADTVVRAASVEGNRSMNRGLAGSKSLSASASYEGDKLTRDRSVYTPPPTLTLNTKYDGVPAISPFVGYAVQVVDKSGNRRVVVGPATILLEYDETLAVLELSSGKPKTTDSLIRDVYLRVDNNIVSDIVRVETRDLVNVDIRLSYRVNFLREHQDKWFAVENYVKYLCDHMRSLLKGAVKSMGVKEFIENSTTTVRDTILGEKIEGQRRSHLFEENGMEIYDVEVLGTSIADNQISNLLIQAQRNSVENAITLASEEQNLENTRKRVAVQGEIAELQNNLEVKKINLQTALERKKAEALMETLRAEIARKVEELDAEVIEQEQRNTIAEESLNRRKANENYTIELEEKRTQFFKTRFEAITPDLVAAMQTLGNTEFANKLAIAIAPLAIQEHTGLSQTMERMFRGTALETVLENVQARPAKAGK